MVSSGDKLNLFCQKLAHLKLLGDILPEAGLHVLESVVAREIGEVELQNYYLFFILQLD